MLRNVEKANLGPLDQPAMKRLFERVIDEARHLERVAEEVQIKEGRSIAMVVVMRERASDAQVQSVIAKLTEMGFDVHRSTGALRTVLGRGRRLAAVRHGAARGARRRAGGPPDHRAVQAREPDLQAGEHRHHHRRRPHRRRRGDRDGRPVLGGKRRAGRVERGGGEARRRQDPARRRVQAAQQPLQLPGPRRGRAAAAAIAPPTGTTCCSSPR